MLNGKTFLAIIPARGGSKRLPRKNVLEIGGKPLIAWSIDAAIKSSYIDKVIVTSDDAEILEIAQHYGADIVKRPIELAKDTATTYDAIKHTVDNVEKYDYIILLQPTSPLRNEQHIDEAINLLHVKQADAIVSVCKMEHSPLWSNVLPEDGDMSFFIRDEIKNRRSQDLSDYYRLNGAIYICKTENFLDEKTFFIKKNIFAYKMKRKNSIDIDEEIDFEICKVFLRDNCLL
ncbi:MAG: acylneuraminate cytidylyltransferase family protein [Epsilonproteobacteria bacterium]|nr:acylneuraminate cytidylyltransferase family protein [Campylobacterota bacterium]